MNLDISKHNKAEFTEFMVNKLSNMSQECASQCQWCATDDLIVGHLGDYCQSCRFQDCAQLGYDISGQTLCGRYGNISDFVVR